MSDCRKDLKLFKSAIGVSLSSRAPGVVSQGFNIITGSKAIVTLQVESLDVGSSVVASVKNSFSKSLTSKEIGTITLDAIGCKTLTFTDIHSLLDIDIQTLVGNVEYALGITMVDDGISTVGSNVSKAEELCRLVPVFYDDVQVISEAFNQPEEIHFFKGGVVFHKIFIDYFGTGNFQRARIIP